MTVARAPDLRAVRRSTKRRGEVGGTAVERETVGGTVIDDALDARGLGDDPGRGGPGAAVEVAGGTRGEGRGARGRHRGELVGCEWCVEEWAGQVREDVQRSDWERVQRSAIAPVPESKPKFRESAEQEEEERERRRGAECVADDTTGAPVWLCVRECRLCRCSRRRPILC